MEEVVPVVNNIPYTVEDLSIVIPQVSWHKRRIEWFLPQFVNATPPEVLKNTIVTHDGDKFTIDILNKYGIKGLEVTPDWSTYKMMAGFNSFETRLCARVHNDCFMVRSDWAESLIRQFNQTEERQLIGMYHPSGIMAKDILEKVANKYPNYMEEFKRLPFDPNGRVEASFLAAFFTSGQTSIFKELYPILMEINENKMDKEDCLLTLLAKVNGVTITNWENLTQFARPEGRSGEFEEFLTLPTKGLLVDEQNVTYLERAKFGRII